MNKNETNKSVLSYRIREKIKEKKLTQLSIAKEIKYDKDWLNECLRKGTMSEDMLEKICKVLNVIPYYFVIPDFPDMEYDSYVVSAVKAYPLFIQWLNAVHNSISVSTATERTFVDDIGCDASEVLSPSNYDLYSIPDKFVRYSLSELQKDYEQFISPRVKKATELYRCSALDDSPEYEIFLDFRESFYEHMMFVCTNAIELEKERLYKLITQCKEESEEDTSDK